MLLSLDDYEDSARETLSPAVYAFVSAGAGDEVTVKLNRSAYDGILLRPRVLADVSRLDTRTTLFGEELASPIILAPTAFQRAIHPEGELAMAEGATRAGALFVVSSSTTTRVEDIAATASGPRWFQLYVQSDREFVRDTVQAAMASGCSALCVTVDNPVSGPRYRQQRTGFALPNGMETPYLRDAGGDLGSLNDYRSAPLSWDDVDWLRSLTDAPLLFKGITHPDDARRAVDAGVSGLIVSNHGGRNLDTQPATATVFPEVAEAVGGRVPLLLDGGIRRGTDVLKALAMGADAVLIGRPYLYGLAVAGADGVCDVVGILRRELEMAMALTGCVSLADMGPEVLWDNR